MHSVYEDELYSVYAEVLQQPKGQGVGVLRDGSPSIGCSATRTTALCRIRS